MVLGVYREYIKGLKYFHEVSNYLQKLRVAGRGSSSGSARVLQRLLHAFALGPSESWASSYSFAAYLGGSVVKIGYK
ncbi:hypothetical protein MPNT_70021 [Candidatus Methylacidithermus pantelleriae]|uniref:Uncharacterized protein n=1 Tax=Candidatus Methylacidithermus pantelleriae TaxID=2744239 RepID=A0A8J2BL56_9BACT|nr:hypothetical protein MPNT_70021 [Candidatus Methylacidithermus pantelleriae]